MTFLNPFVLFGLAAAAIPVVLHLLNLRKLKTVEFSTLRFLKELQRTRMRRLRIRQWILLALRTLLVVFLIMAFSRPAMKGSLGGFGSSEAGTSMMLVLDDSPSMGTRNERGILFEQMKETAGRILSIARPGDDITLLRLSETNRAGAKPTGISPETARDVLRGMSLTQKSFRFDAAVAAARRVAAGSQNANRELYLLTDAQGTQFSPDESTSDSTLPPNEHLRVFLTEIPSRHVENAAVSGVIVESRILAPQTPVLLRAVVRNFGDLAISNSVASVYLEGTRVAQQSLSATAGGAATLQFSILPSTRGILTGYVQIEDDILDIDNRRGFVLNIPAQVRILLVGPSSNDTRFPFAALTLGGDSSLARVLLVDRITQDRIGRTDLGGYDVLILANIHTCASADGARIAAAMKEGKGLMLFPGKNPDLPGLNSSLLGPMGIPQIATSPSPTGPGAGGFITFGTVDYSHPLFAEMFAQQAGRRTGAPTIDGPRILGAATLTAGRTGLPVISMTDGRPFLCEYTVGKGRVLAFSVDADTGLSDFPFKGLFAPLLHRSVLYLASQGREQDTATAGGRLTIPVRLAPANYGRPVIVKFPSGLDEQVTITPRPGGEAAAVELGDTPEVGVYRVLIREAGAASGQPVLVRAALVHPAPFESDLHRVTSAELDAFWTRHRIPADRVSALPATDEVPRVIRESRYGVELWKLFLGLAIACALGEMFLGRASSEKMEADVGSDFARNN